MMSEQPLTYEQWKKKYPAERLNSFMAIMERDGNPPSVAAQVAAQRMRYEYETYLREHENG
jgi:hypothetical protein